MPKRINIPEIAADDWGFSKGINEGILDLARLGLVRVVSLVANAPHLHYGLAELKNIEGLKFAWHMNFTAGEPVDPASSSSYLVNSKNKNFHSLPLFIWNWWRRQITSQDLAREARGQIQILKNLLGDLSEADGHHHVHLVPGVLGVLEPIYREFNIRRVRLPMEKTHLPSFIGSKLIWLKRKKYSGLEFRIYGYPQQRHFNNGVSFLKAVTGEQRPLIAHPAAYDDFKGNSYGDKLCEERVRQYKILSEFVT